MFFYWRYINALTIILLTGDAQVCVRKAQFSKILFCQNNIGHHFNRLFLFPTLYLFHVYFLFFLFWGQLQYLVVENVENFFGWVPLVPIYGKSESFKIIKHIYLWGIPIFCLELSLNHCKIDQIKNHG